MDKISFVIPIKDKFKMTQETINSLRENTANLGEIIIIDDGSSEVELSKGITGVDVFKKNIGVGVNSAWNYGASFARYNYICWVNNDVLFTKNWDIPLMEALNNDVWIVSPYHTYGKGIPEDFPAGKGKKGNMDGNTSGLPFLGSCFMMKKENWERVGPIDNRLKLWAGDNYIYESIKHDFGRWALEVPNSYIHHFGSQTIDREGIADSLKEDMKEFDKILQERGWKDNVVYPYIPKEIDLRLRLPVKDLYKMNVLNIGAGDGMSGLARQLPCFKYRGIIQTDVHFPYLQMCMKLPWRFTSMTFAEIDVRDIDIKNWKDHSNLVLIFDVLEHLPKEDSIRVVKEIMELGVKLLIFGPLENRLHNHRLEEEVDSQEHLSLWTEQDFKDLGLKTEVLKNFHEEDGEKFDAIWAWNY